jgi:L-asparaginase
VQGVVITHGTDTMEETAYFLHALLGAAGAQAKPVVITGAMRPASALSPDGPQNMLDALAVAGHPGACGVVVAMAGKVFSAVEVQKVHPYRRDAFDACDAGVLGYVEEGRVRMVRTWPAPDGYCLQQWPRGIADTPWPRVEIITSHAGAGGALVDALLADGSAGTDPLRGLVVAGTGNGTVHRALEAHSSGRSNAASWWCARHVAARAASCPRGRTFSTTPGGSHR